MKAESVLRKNIIRSITFLLIALLFTPTHAKVYPQKQDSVVDQSCGF